MQLVPCDAEMLRTLELRPDMEGYDVREDFFKACAGLTDPTVYLSHWARAIVENGTTLAVFGANLVAPGVADSWAYLSPNVLTRAFGLTKLTLRAIQYATTDLELWRIQALVDTQHPERLRWITHLGFAVEGVARRHYFRRDHWLVARITDG